VTAQVNRLLSIDECVAKLIKFDLKKVGSNILHLRFPLYRNMERDSKIEFTFPL
jgi:hypothetical protein